MRTRVIFLVVLTASVLGCKSDPSGGNATKPAISGSISIPSASAANAASPSTASADLEAIDASPSTITTTIDPYRELSRFATEGDVASPTNYAGFTSDDHYLAYSVSTCGPCPLEIHYESPTEKSIALRFSGGEIEDTPLDRQVAHDREVTKKIAELGAGKIKDGRVLRGPFPYSDLMFAISTAPGSRKGGVALLFGARVIANRAEKPVFPLRVEIAPNPLSDPKSMPEDERARVATLDAGEREKALADWSDSFTMTPAQLAYANVTRDGKEIGVVAVARGYGWYEAGGVARMPTPEFAAQVYNDTGMRHLADKDFSGASALFEKAVLARPGASLFAYNFASALAHTNDPRTKDVLARAIKNAGEKSGDVKARARKDPDFEAVRSESWFSESVR